MKLAAALLVVLGLVAACRNGERPPSNAGGTSGTPAPPPAPTAGPLPAGHQCLPAMVCDDWVGCALVAGDKVVSADKLPAGQPVIIDDPCGTPTCTAVRAMPAGVVCQPHTVPPLIAPPPYTCAWDGAACVKK